MVKAVMKIEPDSWYVLDDDLLIPGRWDVDDPDQVVDGSLHPDAFTMAERVTLRKPLTAKASRGRRLDYTLGGVGVPYLSQKMASHVSAVCGDGVQLLPVDVRGESFFIMNVLEVVDCIDETRSRLTRAPDWVPGERGGIRMVVDLRIDGQLARGHHMFRLRHWEVVIIVSGEVAQWMASGYVGCRFDCCS
jgi:hypothetical protein